MTSLQEQAEAAYYDNNGELHIPASEAEKKNTDNIIFNGDSGDRTEESINIEISRDHNLSPNDENNAGTTGDKQLFEVIKSRKGYRDGIYYCSEKNDGSPFKMWVCNPLYVLADTRDHAQNNWGRLLSWHDNDNHEHVWACPAELLQASDQIEFRKALANGGLIISTNPRARKLLCDYVLTYRTDKKARCVDRIGWSNGRYVLNSRVIGREDHKDSIVYQGPVSADFATNGTLEDWKKNVSALAVENSRITFAISCSFAGVLAEIAGETGGGFQFTGETSKGKTSTLMDPAASVWGHPDSFAKKWRTTTNGLEALCLARNHNILILDDLGQIEPSEAGQAAYLIANGQGKARMTKDVSARPPIIWKTLLLSSGEVDLSQHVESAGKKARGGQVVRLPSIPADTGSGWYTIENLHGCTDGKEFSGKIKGSARLYYGSAGVAFLEKLAGDYLTIEAGIKTSISDIVKIFNLSSEYPPEVGRVAERFALVAYAGELATEYGVTGWQLGASLSAVQQCFSAWLAQSDGSVGYDEQNLLHQISTYLQTYGGSRFPNCDINPDDLAKVQCRSGFTRIEAGELQYLVESGAFRNELCKGFNLKWATEVLIKKGWLIPGSDRPQQKPRVKALGKTVRVYVIDSKAIEGDEF